MDNPTYEGWKSVHTSGTDYEANLVCERLRDSGIKAVILPLRDHVFNVTIGDLSRMYVMVSPEHEQQALDLLAQPPIDPQTLDDASQNQS